MSVLYKEQMLKTQEKPFTPQKETSFSLEGFLNPAVRMAKVYNPPLFEREGCRLYMNENLLGPSPQTLEAIKHLTPEQLYLYPYGGNHYLVQAIAEKFGINPDEVIVNMGAASVIQQIFQTFVEKDDIICLPKPGWDYYRAVGEMLGAQLRFYAIKEVERTFRFDVDEMIEQYALLQPKIVVITSPNMPTGNMMSMHDLDRLLSNLPGSLVVLDEVYYGFSRKDRINAREMLSKHPNLLIIRTFSKYYALAGLRVGCAFAGKEMVNYINKMTPLFGLPWYAQSIVKAALDDQEYYEKVTDLTIENRETFREKVNQLDGFWAYPSESNFVLINTTHAPEALIEHCREQGYLIRDCKGYGLMSHIRVSMGKREQMDGLAQVICEFVHSKK